MDPLSPGTHSLKRAQATGKTKGFQPDSPPRASHNGFWRVFTTKEMLEEVVAENLAATPIFTNRQLFGGLRKIDFLDSCLLFAEAGNSERASAKYHYSILPCPRPGRQKSTFEKSTPTSYFAFTLCNFQGCGGSKKANVRKSIPRAPKTGRWEKGGFRLDFPRNPQQDTQWRK